MSEADEGVAEVVVWGVGGLDNAAALELLGAITVTAPRLTESAGACKSRPCCRHDTRVDA